MSAWSVCDSNSGVITRSRHCSERPDAVQEPEVSYCVHAGSKYMFSLRTIAPIAAVADGYGSITTSRSSFFIASTISLPRVWLFGAWPQYTTARRLGSWSMFSFFSSTPSIQRDTVMPGFSISACEAKRPLIQS